MGSKKKKGVSECVRACRGWAVKGERNVKEAVARKLS